MDLETTIKRLRKLGEQVPKPLQRPTENQVRAAEKALGVAFHPDFKKYLLEASDIVYGTKEPVTIVSSGNHTFLETVAKNCREAGLPKDLVPICYDNGDCYAMNVHGEVVFWSHDGQTNEKWPSLGAWINAVWIEEG